MFEDALRANLPIIGVTTDDPGSFPKILQLIAEGVPKPMPSKLSKTAMGTHPLWWTDGGDIVDRELYTLFLETSKQLIVCNPTVASPYIFDAGSFPTPKQVLVDFLTPLTEDVDAMLACLRGMSLKAANEAVHITEARTGALTVPELRKTRMLLNGAITGLDPLDTSVDFYQMSKQMVDWLDLNTPFFFASPHPKLVPRGLMFAGPPGTGKSLIAKVIAQRWDVPLYHLDLSAVLSKYIGASEARLREILATLDREEPCVVLIDEVEKVIHSGGDDLGVGDRLLAQLLWWLQEHQSRVFTVMTTNDLDALPRELYRAGRIDDVIAVKALTKEACLPFAAGVYESIMGVEAPLERRVAMVSAINQLTGPVSQIYSHANITSMVYKQIKANQWLPIDKLSG